VKPVLSTLAAGSVKYESALTDFLCDLVRIPTVNGRDTEAALTTRITEEARTLGLDSRLVARQPDRPNILVTYGEGAEGFAIIAHMDTVAEGNLAGWSSPPFAAEEKDGLVIGRGAADIIPTVTNCAFPSLKKRNL
jgi:acetylornithine deacetylase/succinyl-diaminopimelate desuccinylase-like protein